MTPVHEGADPARAVGEHRPRRAVLDRGTARTAVAPDERRARRARGRLDLGGGYFDLGSAAFDLTRIATGQLDAYVDVGQRIVDEVPSTEAAFVAVGEGRGLHQLPLDVAAATLVLRGGRGCGHPRRRPRPRRPPAIGSSRTHGLAVLGAASPELRERLLAEIDRGLERLRHREQLHGDDLSP